MALQEKLIEPSVMLCLPQSVQDVQLLLFFGGPVMLAARLREVSALPRYGRKVQSLEDRPQAQKVFVLFLARCKG